MAEVIIIGAGLAGVEAAHEDLDTLVHELSEPNHTEYIRVSGRVTNIIVWTDIGKTVKISSNTYKLLTIFMKNF